VTDFLRLTTAESGIPVDDLLNSLPVRVMMVFVSVIILASILPLVFLLNINLSAFGLKWVLVILFGCIAGFTSHILIRNGSSQFQSIVAFVSLFIGFIPVGWLTSDYIGYGWAEHLGVFRSLEWAAQFLLANLIAISVIRIGNASLSSVKAPGNKVRSRVKTTQSIKPEKAPVPRGKTIKPDRSVRLKKTRSESSQSKQGRGPNSKNVTAGKPPKKRIASKEKSHWENIRFSVRKMWGDAKTAKERIGEGFSRRLARPQIQLTRRYLGIRPRRTIQSNIRLIGDVEQRCPYCLELVEKNDPRGVKICPICHTYHHADCWNVTGMCQVPHQHGG
jgi:hypothetical protein